MRVKLSPSCYAFFFLVLMRAADASQEEQEGYDGSIVGAKIKVWWPDDRK